MQEQEMPKFPSSNFSEAKMKKTQIIKHEISQAEIAEKFEITDSQNKSL